MKKVIAFRLCFVIIISALAIVFMNYYIQAKSAKESMYANSLIRINQISEVLEKNDLDIAHLKETLKEDYFIRAEAAAYIIQNNPSVAGDLEEMKKIALLLQVDEIHLFNREGILYAGTEPQYLNYTFRSGEQMQFFLPMLEDTSLQLCQDITPNTAEGKLMQYLAVWREDKQGIIQIGMRPIRLLEAMKSNELPHIFSLLTTGKDITIFAIDQASGEVAGSTDNTLMGMKKEDLAIGREFGYSEEEGFTIRIDGEKNFCVAKPAGNYLICASTSYSNLYSTIPDNMSLVVISICLISFVIIVIILKMLDKMFIRGIQDINYGMNQIAAGNLDYRVEAVSSSEFIELSNNINNMVISLLEITGKLSLVFQNVNIPIAVYEYNEDMKRVLATNKIGEILMLSEDEISEALSDHAVFLEKMNQIRSNPFEKEKDIYLLGTEDVRYIKIKSFSEAGKILGIVVDVTEEMVEKQRIRYERDVDLLTGLLSRRAFFAGLDRIINQKATFKNIALLMVDTDNLKYVNDNWGHEYGDKLLKRTAELLLACDAPVKLAARLSGDEFVLMIYGTDSIEEMQGSIERLYDMIMQTSIQVPGQEMVPVRMSGGYVFYPGDTENIKEMLHLADETMYRVKKSTKGRFEKYQKPLEE